MNYLNAVTERLTGIDELAPSIGIAVANRIEELVTHGTTAQLQELHRSLQALTLKIKALAPAEASAFSDRKSPAYASFLLGQFNFAGLLASQVANQRGDDDYIEFVNDSRYRDYFAALLKADLSGSELSKLLGEHEGTVSRKMKICRGKGLVEFRREGTRIVNFLTPAAKHILSAHIQPLDETPLHRHASAEIKDELEKIYRGAPNFSMAVG